MRHLKQWEGNNGYIQQCCATDLKSEEDSLFAFFGTKAVCIYTRSTKEVMDLLLWFIVCLAVLCFLYWYLNAPYSYWKRYGIPSVPPVSLFGSLLAMFRTTQHETEVERYKKYGRLYGHYEGRRPVLNVADPELLRNILVKDFQFFVNRRDATVGDPLIDNMISVLESEKWKRVRSLMTPAFTTGKIKKMLSIILDSAKTLCQNFEKSAETGEPVEAKKLFGAFTLDVIASVAFATKVDSHNDPDNKFVTMASKAFSNAIPIRITLFILFPSLFKFFHIPVFSSVATSFFRDTTLRIIEERKKTGQTRNDFLQLMMEAAGMVQTPKSEKEDQNDEETTLAYKVPASQKGMSHDELLSQCVIFFLAGFNTTATTLTFASYLLALNPDCQERLIEEVDATLLNHKGSLTYEAIQSMKYLDCVISEALRIFPPGGRLERRADQDYELGHTGFTIPKGMIVSVPVYAIHHDPEFYPDPEKFDPDRFSAEEKAERNPYTYLPFGSGPRNCIGMRFALMEIKLCLALLFSKLRLKPCSQTKIPLEFYAGRNLQPKSIILRAELRKDRV